MATPLAAAASLPQRVLAAFLAPRRLARGLAVEPRFVDVLAITTGVAMLGAAALPEEFFLARTENPVDRLGRPVTVTSSPEEIVRWGRYLQVLSALVQHPVLVLSVAGVVTLLFSVVGGGRAGFREYVALASHALLVYSLGTLLIFASWLLLGRTPEMSVGSLLGPLAPGSGSGLGALLDGVYPFEVWTLLVLAAGVAELDGKRSFAAAAAVLLGLYLALVALVAGLA